MIRIGHLADIHVRNLSRHPEYKEVFQAFIDDCRVHKIDHIFVGGDTFHTKTSGMAPECINFMCWLLESLAAVAEVHLTLGNHDFNMANPSRQDAISPIVEALRNPRIHLYKASGTYEFVPGYVWCVFSLFDEEGWEKVRPIPGKVNIACYHGPVWGARTETGWLIEDGVTMSFFKDYDFVMLGDIHKLQFLQSREIELEIDESDLSKYPGAEVIKEEAAG
jgi:hypothetical protein